MTSCVREKHAAAHKRTIICSNERVMSASCVWRRLRLAREFSHSIHNFFYIQSEDGGWQIKADRGRQRQTETVGTSLTFTGLAEPVTIPLLLLGGGSGVQLTTG